MCMKKLQLLFKAFVGLLCLFSIETALAQNVGISASSGFTPDASAGLDVSFTNKGLLIPRVALTATNAAGPITAPATSLLVYNTATAGTAPTNVTPGYYYWNGVAWNMLSTSAQTATTAWSTTGNAGTSYPTNYLGTSDNFGLHFKTAATHRFWIDSLGSVAVGLNPVYTAGTARERFLVDAGSTSTYPTPTGAFNVISGKGYLDNYLQLNIQNNSPTANASTDIVATADNGTETANFIDMGINSSANNTTGAIGGANTAYLYGTGNDMAIGNGTANKSLIFFTGGTSPTTYTERIRLDASGRVGIGTNSPTSDLTLNQSSGTGGAKGFRFAGNSIAGTNSGTGFLFSLGFNLIGNKQMWFGDPDAANNSASTFLRIAAGTTNLPTLDAVAGDNSTRRFIALGTAGDPNAGVIFGNDGAGSTSPSSFVWDNGNMAIGNGYKTNAAPANGLLVQGNVGIGLTAPTATLTLKAGTATAGTAPLKLTPGTNLSTPEAGAVEFDGTNYFVTSGSVRYTLDKTLTATATLDFPITAGNASSNLTVTVTGAADGDVVFVGAPNASVAANSSYTAYVSAANTVTVKFANSSIVAIDPASGTFRVSVLKY